MNDVARLQSQFFVYQQLTDITYRLDQIVWNIDDQTKDHPITTEFFLSIRKELHQCFKDYLERCYVKMEYGCGDELMRFNGYFFEKYERVFAKVFNLDGFKPIPSHQPLVPVGNPTLLINNTDRIECPSFQGPSVSCAIQRISFHLRDRNDVEAQREFNELPSQVQEEIYEALWIVRGSPSVNHAIGHENFGEVSFKAKEPRCASTPRQKACAVELIKMQIVVWEMIQFLAVGDKDGLIKALETLPLQMRNEIYRKHWELMDRPTKSHPNESLKKMAHWNFGKVSLLGLESRCDVPMEKKIQTCKAYLADIKQKNSLAQRSVEEKKAVWYKNEIDRDMDWEERAIRKKEDLHFLAKKIVPLFLGNEVSVLPPAPVLHLVTNQPDNSYFTIAAGYVEMYPCLRPFFLQLINTLSMKD